MTQMSNPHVSVIIPAYNAEMFISEALDSVLAQTYRPIEVIVVNDGSSDRTDEIIRNYQTKITSKTRINNKSDKIDLIYIHQENSGPSKARNTGIKAAKGEYIAFLDADDLWLPKTVERQMEYITSNKNVFLVFGDGHRFNSGEKIVNPSLREDRYPVLDRHGEISNAFEKLLEGNFILTGTVLLKKECLEKVGYFNERMMHGEDYDLWVRISMFYSVGYIPEILMLRRIHEGSLSKRQENFYKSKLSFLKDLKKRDAVIIKRKNIDINHYILSSIRKLSYLYYIKKQYLQALITITYYIIYLFKTRLTGAR